MSWDLVDVDDCGDGSALQGDVVLWRLVDVDDCGDGGALQGDVVLWRLFQTELGDCHALEQLADMTFGYTFNRCLQGVPLATRA